MVVLLLCTSTKKQDKVITVESNGMGTPTNIIKTRDKINKLWTWYR